MREWEKSTWASGVTEEEVIRRAGQAVAHRASLMTRPGDLVLLLAGRGHNGDDVRFAGQFLKDRRVILVNVTDPAAARDEFLSRLSLQPLLVVDGLFGIGLNRPLEKSWIELVEVINKASVPILAVDVPSGLSAETGWPMDAAIRATVTLTMGAPKRGLLASIAWPYVGRCAHLARRRDQAARTDRRADRHSL
jgi:NAD(P)H-hydrate repair Nnr-like enzyme with NAD(P)H-hydrate epimerase domain